jgi:hypothetical protein
MLGSVGRRGRRVPHGRLDHAAFLYVLADATYLIRNRRLTEATLRSRVCERIYEPRSGERRSAAASASGRYGPMALSRLIMASTVSSIT